MTVEKELAEIVPDRDSAVTIGVFDGVHLGHRELINRIIKTAREQGLESVVVTFRQHPLAILTPEQDVPYITDLAQRRRLLQNAGVDRVVVLSFTPELAALSAAEFLGLLKRHLKMRALVIGHDFALGRGRTRDPESLRALGNEIGFSVEAIGAVCAVGEVVSSSNVRQALAAGDMPRAYHLLGRYFSLHGSVVTGNSRGTWLGYPTANLEVPPNQAMPPDGVYAVRAHVGGAAHQAVAYLGYRPTFADTEHMVEVYLLDFKGDLYEQDMRVDMISFVRADRKFDKIEELKAQIARDVTRGREVLATDWVKPHA